MWSREKKRKTTIPTTELTSILSLPDDLVLSCLARVSRLYYPTLSLVSKSFRSLLASPELYASRSSLSRQESCLYVCFRFPPDPNPRWFTLCCKPNQTLTNHTPKKKSSSGYALATIPIPQSPPAHFSGLVTIGSGIYNIGGCIHQEPSSSVSIFDCRSHTWREAPSMRVKRDYTLAANLLGGKIYVTGGCEECNASNWMEVFDPKTQTWELVSSPGAELCGSNIGKSAAIDGMIYMFGGNKGFAYEPKENSCESVGWEMNRHWVWFSYCVIENVLYSYYREGFIWYTKVKIWRDLKGVEGLPKFPGYGSLIFVRSADYGGKMVILWDEFVPSSGFKNRMIWCAVIAIEKRDNGEEIWGKVEWCDAVLAVPKSYEFVHALAATV